MYVDALLYCNVQESDADITKSFKILQVYRLINITFVITITQLWLTESFENFNAQLLS